MMAYKFRGLLSKLDFIPAIKRANSLLKMEEINREVKRIH